jgi:hypothetical protein
MLIGAEIMEARQAPSDMSAWSSARNEPEDNILSWITDRTARLAKDNAQLTDSNDTRELEMPFTAGRPSGEETPPIASHQGPFGVDDTGNWRFVITPRSKREPRRAGLRQVDLIYESTSSHRASDAFFEYA